MTEVEYVIANFPMRLSNFKNKRTVLHGSRNYAEAIIEKYTETFNFIGIMSLDSIDGTSFHGLKVVHEEELPDLNIDVIILTERVKYAVEAFRSIQRVCKKNRIAIFNMYGIDEFLVHREAENADVLNLVQAKRLCDSYDIIAFEVIDTVFYAHGTKELLPRRLFYDLIRYLQNQGKEIRYSLRKSFPASVQIQALEKFKFLADKNCQVIFREGEDLSFRELRDKHCKEKILYFGYGLANEFILPRYYGIDTCRFIGVNNYDVLFTEKKQTREKTIGWNDRKQVIKKQIMEKELISFDIFDTLLIRKTLYPSDVFYLVEQKALLAGYNAKGFASARMRAGESPSSFDIHHIYEWLQDYFGWNEETTKEMQSIEIETEREVLVLRDEVAELLSFAHISGKHVVLTSDMYIPANILRQILTEKGVLHYEKIFVSCDFKKYKHDGLYQELYQLCSEPGKILHIGDNPVTDGLDCKSFGISSIVIPSVFDMAKDRGWESVFNKASSLMERCLIGLVLTKVFRDPFRNPNLSDCPVKVQLQHFGISIIGPLAVGYLTWLIQRLKKENFSGVLFLARDGWLFYNIYRKIQGKMTLPQSIYYYANRRATFLCCTDFEKDLEKILEHGQLYGVNIKAFLKDIYQIPDDRLISDYKEIGALEYVEKNKERILKKVEMYRKRFLAYSKKHGMVPGNLYAIFDFIAVGNTQKHLSEFLPFDLKGFYYGKHVSEPVATGAIDYYQKSEKSLLLNGYVEKLEPFITSMEPSQIGMSEDGKPVFAEEYRSLHELRDIETVLKTAEAFGYEFFDLLYQEGQTISPSLIEEIYKAAAYCVSQYTVYDDWFGVPIRKREEVTKENNDEYY